MTELTVSLEHRFYRYEERVYTKLAFSYVYWEQYLSYFDRVNVVARVMSVPALEEGMVAADGESVRFLDMPYYVGPREFLLKLPALFIRAYTIVKSNSHFLLRSGNISNLLFIYIMLLRLPYIREFPGDIRKGVAGYSGGTFVGRVLASVLDRFARFQARYSKANSFVSESTRMLYESSRPSYVFSSFDLSEVSQAKCSYGFNETLKLVALGRLEKEKGHADLLRAIGDLIDKGLDVSLLLIGDGSERMELARLAAANNIDCQFVGAVTDRKKMYSLLVHSDIFVLPSHTEGMPRALLEAMAVGLPCIATAVGGVPEVLPADCLVPQQSSEGISSLVMKLSKDENLRENLGRRNVELVREMFDPSMSRARQIEFWGRVCE
ncbi:MAG: glycosyltransferase [Alcanivoracaceae bacterium]|nr:glycosyltransferase [Alcanivoracaceae bacterium]